MPGRPRWSCPGCSPARAAARCGTRRSGCTPSLLRIPVPTQVTSACRWPRRGLGSTRALVRAQALRLSSFAAAHPGTDPGDIGLSLATTRARFDQRAVVVGKPDSLLQSLATLAAGQPAAGVIEGETGGAGRIAVVFAGQGGQRARMGRGLYRS